MVFCGAPSRGCELCRKRRVKCDEGRPECLKCTRLRQKCPGYRNLSDVRFRDESARIVRRHRQDEISGPLVIQEPCAQSQRQSNTPAPVEGLFASSQPSSTIAYPLSQSSHDLGANFFFAKYSPNDGPFFSNYHAWLIKSYFEQGSNNVLRAIIEAVGMAGLSNVFYTPRVKSQCQAQYCAALVSMKKALNDPVQAVSDTTFMALILLAFFETVTFTNRDRHHHWAAHVRAGTAILELRGREQFNSERGGLLYVQFRSYILLACMQEHVAVPTALVQATFNFQTGAMRQDWQHANIASPGSITEICIRVVNLWAALRSHQVTDPQAIRGIALEIDGDLDTWRAGLPPSWGYATVHVPAATNDACFDGKKHVYPNLWIAEGWNYWRALRVLVNQIILQNEVDLTEPDDASMALAISIIRQLCIEICISTYSFRDTPRILSLMQPLFVVALEGRNDVSVCYFASEQLRCMNATMGIRQAAFMADTASKALR